MVGIVFQLYMVRTMLESLIAEKNTGGKKTLRKDIDYQHFLAIDNFHKNSFFWSYVINFNGKAKKCMCVFSVCDQKQRKEKVFRAFCRKVI